MTFITIRKSAQKSICASRSPSPKTSQGIVFFKTIITLQRDLLALSGEAGDEGTNALMSDYIRAQEKLVWMYSAFLDKK